MNLGNKLSMLRKKFGLSQEEVAERLQVTRQTISNWELGETSPDIKQAKQLASLYRVSLDELTDNDIKDLLDEKISNTERLAGIIIKILKIFGVFLLIAIIFYFVLIIGGLVVYNSKSTNNSFITEEIDCSLEGNNYIYSIKQDENHQIMSIGGSNYLKNVLKFETYKDGRELHKAIVGYFEKQGGSCE